MLPFFNRIVSLNLEVRSLLPRAGAVLRLLEQLRATPSRTAVEPAPDFIFPRRIKLENIHFRYPEADRDALDGVSLTLRRGQKSETCARSCRSSISMTGTFLFSCSRVLCIWQLSLFGGLSQPHPNLLGELLPFSKCAKLSVRYLYKNHDIVC